MMAKIDCSAARRLTHLRLDGELAAEDSRLLMQHTARCRRCERANTELEELDGALREGLAACPPAPQPVDATRRQVKQARLMRRVLSTLLPAAAAFILVAGSLFFALRDGGHAVNVAVAVVVSGGEAIHVFEPNQRVAQPGQTGTELQEHAVAWGLSSDPIALRFAGGARAQLSNEAVVRIGRNSLDLFNGDLRADLRDAEESFTVGTPWGQFESRDAVFLVHSDPDDSNAVVRVISGEVRVEQHRWTRVLEAGEQLTLRPDPYRTVAL